MCSNEVCVRGSYVWPEYRCFHPESDGQSCKVASCNDINCMPIGGAKCREGQCRKGASFTKDCKGKKDGNPCIGPTWHSYGYKCIKGECMPPVKVPDKHQCKNLPDGWKCQLSCDADDCKIVRGQPEKLNTMGN